MLRKLALLSLTAVACADEDFQGESKPDETAPSTPVTAFEVPSTSQFFFAETFESGLKWVKSSASDYAGQPVEVTTDSSMKAPFDKDHGLVLQEDAKKYGVAGKFAETLTVGDKPLVVQYEVKLTKGLSCGGAYVKLLREEVDVAAFDGASPFTIMFGPDSCGDTNKVHFILQHQNSKTEAWEEKHFTAPPMPLKDTESHLYTLVLQPTNDFEIFVDLASQAKGNLLKDMAPPVNPPKEIDDPTDFKPTDWVDDAQITDPDATKPDDWDESAPRRIPDPKATQPDDWLADEPKEVPDPKAEMPDDWDEEEDGDWEAPVVANPKCEAVSGCGPWTAPEIANPEYKGKWAPPLIANPAYKGEWAAKQIPNPAFVEDLEPAKHLAPMSAVAVEVWTMTGGIRFDNVLVGHDAAAARKFAEQTWRPKHVAEKSVRRKQTEEEKEKDIEAKRAEGGLNNMLEVYVYDVAKLVGNNQMACLFTTLALTAGLIFLCIRGDKKSDDELMAEAAAKAFAEAGPAAAADAAAEDEAKAEVETKAKKEAAKSDESSEGLKQRKGAANDE